MRMPFLPGVCLLLAVPACASSTAKKSDQDRFQGEWTIVKIVQEGEDQADFVKDNSPVMTFKGGNYTFKGEGLAEEAGEFTLEPKAKIPSLDYKITKGEHKGKNQLGIYKLEGDVLTICLAQEGTDKRPTTFKTDGDGPEYVTFTMKRKK